MPVPELLLLSSFMATPSEVAALDPMAALAFSSFIPSALLPLLALVLLSSIATATSSATATLL
jgi:hypothetical protein